MSPDRSIPDLLRQKVEEERGGILGQGADVHFSIDGRGKKVGEYEPKAPNHPLSKETITGKRSEGANTGLLTWNTEEVDAPKYFNRLSSRATAVDASNHPHVVYGGDHLYHAYHDGTAWQYETVDSSSNVGWDASIALDKKGRVHIGYYDKALKYATNASGAWANTTVGAGSYNSLALDASDVVHIGYFDTLNYDLMYTTGL